MSNLYALDETLDFLNNQNTTFEKLIESVISEISINESINFDKIKEIANRVIEAIKKFLRRIKEFFINSFNNMISKLKEFRKKSKEKIANFKNNKKVSESTLIFNEANINIDEELKSKTISMRPIGAFCKALSDDFYMSDNKLTAITGSEIHVGYKSYTLDEYYKYKGCDVQEITLLDFINTYSDEDLWIGKLEEVKKFHKQLISTFENVINALEESQKANSEEQASGILAKVSNHLKDLGYTKQIEYINKSITTCNKILVDIGEMVSAYTRGTLTATRILNDIASNKFESMSDQFAWLMDTDGDLKKMYDSLK